MKGPWVRAAAVPLLALCLVGTVRAQGIPKAYIQARQLLLLQRWDQALGLIESVVPSSEEEWSLRESLLADTYEGQGNYAALELLARGALERKPDRADKTEWLLEWGRVLLLGDDLDSANAVLNRAWKASTDDSTITRVADLYKEHSLSDQALAIYLEARKVRSDSTRFALQIAELYEARRDYARATDEYFRAIRRDSTLTRQVENRVLQLIQTAEGREGIEAELRRAAARPEGAVMARSILTTLYLEDGHPDLAWKAACEVDSLQHLGGANLISFMRLASERGYYEVARMAAATILERYPGSPIHHEAEWEMAQMSRSMGDWQGACEQYATLARTSPVLRFRLESAVEYADLEREHGGRLDLADSVYGQVLSASPTGVYANQALLGKAAVAVARGDLDGARSLLAQVAQAQPQDASREEAAFRLGELSYFEGDLKQAGETWKALTNDFPRSPWVNNALDYLFLLNSYADAAAADLKLLGHAEALSRRGRQDSALVLVTGLRGSIMAPLAPRATVLAANWHRLAGRTDSALAIWDAFAESFPKDPDAPWALLSAARLCELELSKPEAALNRYNKLLEQYPRCQWAEEARSHIRRLGGS
jgi:TolA-binding protein